MKKYKLFSNFALNALVALILMLSPQLAFAGSSAEQAEFSNPSQEMSANGLLRTKFVLQPTELTFNGRKVKSNTYNGLYAPPTLRVRPGDTLELEFENLCPQPSNIHFHGMTISPLNNGDNIFTRVDPGHSFHYKIKIPKDHTPGMYYYHAHAHGVAERQITFGFTGAIIVEGQLNAYPALAKVKEQIMVLKDIQISPFGNVPQDIVTSRSAIRTVNGLINPVIRMHPGETQFWRIANTGANLYYRLTLSGQKFWVLAEDGNPTLQMSSVTEYLLGPSARVEVVVQFPSAGEFVLKTEKVRTGPVGDGYPAAALTTVICEGAPQKPITLPQSRKSCCGGEIENLAKVKIDNKRLIVFNETDTDFRVNNNIFDEDRIDTRVPLGAVEEWTIRNSTDELHQFHIHQVDFQVVEINGKPIEFTGHRDNYVVPIRGEIKIVISFTNPIILGRFVYHCHIIEHEDGGMMATIEVYDPKKTANGAVPTKHLITKSENTNATGGPLHLTDQAGASWRGEDSQSDFLLVSFGYTRCEGACPRTLLLLDETSELLKNSATQALPLLVTVDPERDTPEILREYAALNPSKLITLTGSLSEISDIAKSFGVAIKKQFQPDGSYSVSHSTDLFLVTRKGRVIKRFDLITPAEEIAKEVRLAGQKADSIPLSITANTGGNP